MGDAQRASPWDVCRTGQRSHREPHFRIGHEAKRCFGRILIQLNERETGVDDDVIADLGILEKVDSDPLSDATEIDGRLVRFRVELLDRTGESMAHDASPR